MPRLSNQEIAKILQQMAIFYEMEEIPFKPRAYEKVALAIESLDRELFEIYSKEGEEGIRKIPGVGESLAQHLISLLKKGSFPEYEKYKKRYPIKLEELLNIQGLGPKKIKVLYEKLKIKNLADLEKALAQGKISKLPNFGLKSEEKIRKGVELLKRHQGRFLLGFIEPIVQEIEKRLAKLPEVKKVVTAGSYRRRQETIGDIDILVCASKSEKVMKTFVQMPEVEEVLASGPTKTMVRLRQGIQADVRLVPEKSYGSALQYFTGSKDHNIKLRKIAIEKGLKLNEYGLFKGKKQIAGKTEEEVYHALGLSWIPPELRTDSGEIEAAQNEFLGKTPGLPKLIPYNSIRGDLQVQTSWSDGENSLEEMAEAAWKSGLEYIAITDHTKSLAMASGLDEKRLSLQGQAIDKLNEKYKNRNFKILKSAEINVLKDGKLDIKDEALKKLDLVSVALHSHFNLSEEEQTKRIIKALKHPLVNIMFHPTGRIIGRREPYALNLEKIFKAAAYYGVALEIDAFPDRLDLKDTHIRLAKEMGVKFVIDSDAHSILHFRFYNLGIAQARRGWLSQEDVLNTFDCQTFLEKIRSLKKV